MSPNHRYTTSIYIDGPKHAQLARYSVVAFHWDSINTVLAFIDSGINTFLDEGVLLITVGLFIE